MGIADYLSRHPSPIEGESVKASEFYNTRFTVNHVNNLNDVSASELNEPIRGRRWLKLQRSDKRSKSAQLSTQNKQTVACENENQSISTDNNKMGQAQQVVNLTKFQTK